MTAFDPRHQRRLVTLLAAFHIAVIAASNYLVQIPCTLFGLYTTWGAFTFPFIFLATDLTVRLFGARTARRIVLRVMFPALVVSYLLSVAFDNGRFAGWPALASLNPTVARIAVASFAAYLFGQLLDVAVFSRLRRLRRWWIAPAASTVIGNALDTLIFFFVAFAASRNVFMASHWMELAAMDYAFKLTVSLLVFLPLYGILLRLLARRLVLVTAGRAPRAVWSRAG